MSGDRRSESIARVAAWASIECEKQRSGERSVGWMVNGWSYAYRHKHEEMSDAHILRLAHLVEPRKNYGDWRQMAVRVGQSVKAPWDEVPRLMANLILAWPVLGADEWYHEFEEIHPFLDGNGRTGNILWNWHRDSLAPDRVTFPPDFWGNPRLEMPDLRAKVVKANA